MTHCWHCDNKQKRVCPLCGRCDECHTRSLACPGLPLLEQVRQEIALGIIGDSMAIHTLAAALDKVLDHARKLDGE